MACQLKDINGIRVENSRYEDLFQYLIKIAQHIKRNLTYIKRSSLGSVAKPGKKPLPYAAVIAPGDTVRVRSEKEIREMLDEWGKHRGCLFVGRMYEHCGKTYKVFKEVDYFFDEVKQRMCRCRDTVLLEGVLCSGKQKLYAADCDRRCFYFWHKDWLEKCA